MNGTICKIVAKSNTTLKDNVVSQSVCKPFEAVQTTVALEKDKIYIINVWNKVTMVSYLKSS